MGLTLEDIRVNAGGFVLEADFTVQTRARLAVIGPSGSGKSTLLDVIAGFRQPERGRVVWHGRDITPLAPGARPVGILFQDTNLFPHLTVAQNLGLALRPGSGRLLEGDAERIAEVLSRVGLSGFEGRRPGQMSGGQQSRAALARLLLQDRPVLLLDEPFAALGPALKEEMLDLVGEVSEAVGATVLLVTHDPRDARRFAAETVLVDAGRALPPQDTTRLLDNPPPGLKAYLGAG